MNVPITTIKDLIISLNKNPKNADYCQYLIKNVHFTSEEIKKITSFKKERYTRNLIHKNSNYEIMTLCWLPNQETAIHDHNQSEGWMTVIQGEVTETSYVQTNSTDLILNKKTDIKMLPGDHSYINDQIGYHSIKCNKQSPSITLHLYSPPITWCSVFDKETKKMKKKLLSFDNVNSEESTCRFA